MDYSDRIFDFDNTFGTELLSLDIGGIFQVSELSIIPGGGISPHLQHCDEITYVVSGSAKVISDGQGADIKTGQIHFIKQGSTHEIQVSAEENFRYICIGYVPNPENNSVKAFYDGYESCKYFIVNDNGMIKNLSEYLIREFYDYDNSSNIMIGQYISQILVVLSRILSGREYWFTGNYSKKPGYYTIYEVLRYIDREYIQIKKIKDISSFLCYSEYYISHLFKEKMGITIKEYINKKKIAYAAQMLQNSDITVEKLVEHLGFSCSYSFRRTFKQYMGMTPTEYKATANFVPPNSK